MSAAKKRLPRRKPIDYSIMRESPFYDGMLTADEKEIVREMRGLYELALTAHYVRNLYVASVWGWASDTTKVATIEMVTAEGFVVMSIRANETTAADGKRIEQYALGGTTGFPDPDQAPFRSFQSNKLSTAVAFVAHGSRRRGGWDDPFSGFLSADRDDDELRKIENPTARIDSVVQNMAYQITRRYELETQYINLDSNATTWAARCASGRASMLDVPHNIRNKIEKSTEEYYNACAKIEETLTKVREGLCRKKLMIGHGMYLANPDKVDRVGGPGNDQPLILAVADFTPMYEALVNHVTNGTPSSEFNIEFDSKPRLYKSFNTLPEDMKARIAPKMIPINLRLGAKPSDWATKMFPNGFLHKSCEYLEEVESLVYTRDNPAVKWYVVNC